MAQRERRSGSVPEALACETPDTESHPVDPTVAVQPILMAEVDSAFDYEGEELHAAADAVGQEAQTLKVCAHCVRSASPVHAYH